MESNGNAINGFGLRSALVALMLLASHAAPADEPSKPAYSNLSERDTPLPAENTAQSANLEEITVTARKQSESILKVPVSITALSAADLTRFDVEKFSDYAGLVPNLSFNEGGGGQGMLGRAISIRGISGSNTTGFYIDDTPVPANVDPHAVDLQRIEVLKGPQGTLYGSGSEGGNIRLVTNQPDTSENSFRYMLKAGATEHGGQPDYGDEAVANLVVIPDRLAVRLMQFVNADAGFITRSYPVTPGSATLAETGNQGQINTYGYSASVLGKITDQFSASFKMIYQSQYDHGWPAVFETAADFNFTSYTLNRAANVQDSFSDVWSLPALVLNYAGSGFSVSSSTSFFKRTNYEVEDGTEGNGEALYSYYGFTTNGQGIPAAVATHEDILTEEDRLAFDEIFHISGVTGFYFSNDRYSSTWLPQIVPGIAAAGLYPSNLAYYSPYEQNTKTTAVFGEFYVHILPSLTLTLGARNYWIKQFSATSQSGLFAGGVPPFATTTKNEGLVPKYSLAYQVTPDTMVYATAAKGLRPGGGGSALPAACDSELAGLGLTPQSPLHYQPDTVWNYEVGAKSSLLDRRLTLTGALFQLNWSSIQQVIFLPICSFPFTGNAGAARSRGAELELNARPLDSLTLRASVGYDDAIITNAGASGLVVGSRINGIPLWTASTGAEYDFPLSTTATGFGIVDYSFTGNSPSLNNTAGTPLIRPSYDIVNARLGVRWKTTELSLYGSNLANSKANLGDLTAISFTRQVTDPQGQVTNDFRVIVPQPLTIGLQWRQSF